MSSNTHRCQSDRRAVCMKSLLSQGYPHPTHHNLVKSWMSSMHHSQSAYLHGRCRCSTIDKSEEPTGWKIFRLSTCSLLQCAAFRKIGKRDIIKHVHENITPSLLREDGWAHQEALVSSQTKDVVTGSGNPCLLLPSTKIYTTLKTANGFFEAMGRLSHA